MINYLQLGGGLLVLVVLFQAVSALGSQVLRFVRRNQLDKQRIDHFRQISGTALKLAQSDHERSQLTWSGKRKFRVARRQLENRAGDICSFYLEPHDGGALPPFHPGQFLTFELQIPDQSAPVIRCYSLSDSPGQRGHYRVTIKKLPPPPNAPEGTPGGLSSTYFHTGLQEGDVVDVMAPNGAFYLDLHSERPVVLIGGGVGLTPVLSMLKALDDHDSHREAWFFYAVRNSDDIALRDEIRQIIDKRANFHLVIVYSNPTEQCVEGTDYHCTGFLSVDVMKRYLPSSNYEFYICGPPPMMAGVTAQLEEWGVPEESIHFEAFGPASVKKTTKADEADAADAEAVSVTFSKSGKTVNWTSADGSLLELAEANGVKCASGCRAGNCGTCATAIKSGSVAYLTRPASKPAKGTALLCVARPEGEVTLDI